MFESDVNPAHARHADDEFYAKRWPELEGRSFGEALLMFPDAVPLGVRTAEENRMLLNPPDEYILQKGAFTSSKPAAAHVC